MGNQHSSSHHDPLYTTAVANYMRLTKHKVILLQQAMERRRRRRNGTICQQHFCQALAEVKLHSTKDQDVLLNLFDLWDVQGTGRVPCDEFIIGLAPLACKRGESISTVLYFAMQLADVEGNGRISASETLLLLQSINATASYFGDAVLGMRQLYKVVDNAFETISGISEGGEEISHRQVIRNLVEDPWIEWVVSKGKIDAVLMDRSASTGTYPNGDGDSTTLLHMEAIEDEEDESLKFNRTRFHCGSLGNAAKSPKWQERKTRFVEEYDTDNYTDDSLSGREDEADEVASEVSSVMLSPIARVHRESISLQDSNSSTSASSCSQRKGVLLLQ